jgi:hypothetical protein
MKKALKSILFVGLLLSVSNAFSQSLVEQIKARAAEISELKTLLNNPDSAVRIAAIDVMQGSDDLAMREMGFSAGINSSDEAIVALTIRNKFKEIKNFTIEFELPKDANEKIKNVFKKLGSGQLPYYVKSYDPMTATMVTNTVASNNYNANSSISGTKLHLKSVNTNGAFSLNDEAMYVGYITYDETTFASKIQLF